MNMIARSMVVQLEEKGSTPIWNDTCEQQFQDIQQHRLNAEAHRIEAVSSTFAAMGVHVSWGECKIISENASMLNDLLNKLA